MASGHRTGLALLLVALVSTDPLSAQETVSPAGEGEVATAPVELDGAVLLTVRGVSSLPAAERARLIEERLTAVAADVSIPIDSLQVVEREGVRRIMAGDRLIIAVTSGDAALEQVPIGDLAVAHLMRLRQAILGYREARSASALKTNALNALGATAVLMVAVVTLLLVLSLARPPAHQPASGSDPHGRDPVVRGDASGTNLERAS